MNDRPRVWVVMHEYDEGGRVVSVLDRLFESVMNDPSGICANRTMFHPLTSSGSS